MYTVGVSGGDLGDAQKLAYTSGTSGTSGRPVGGAGRLSSMPQPLHQAAVAAAASARGAYSTVQVQYIRQ